MSDDIENEEPSRIGALALLTGATLGLAAMWWLKQNLVPPGEAAPAGDAPTASPPPASEPKTSPVTAAAEAGQAAEDSGSQKSNPTKPANDDRPAAKIIPHGEAGSPKPASAIGEAKTEDDAPPHAEAAPTPSPKAKPRSAKPKTAKAKNAKAKSPRAGAKKADDLTRIEGIGPKIAQTLKASGIESFDALAKKSAEELRDLLAAANPRYRMFNPETWPQQAELASRGQDEELSRLQDELKGGRPA